MSITIYEPQKDQGTGSSAPAVATPTTVVVPAAPSGIGHAAGGFFKSLTKLTMIFGVVTVVVTGIMSGERTPAGWIGATEAAMSNAFNNGSRKATADTLRAQKNAEVDAQNRAAVNGPLADLGGAGLVACALGGPITKAAQQNHSDWADLAQGLTALSCALGAAAVSTYGGPQHQN